MKRVLGAILCVLGVAGCASTAPEPALPVVPDAGPSAYALCIGLDRVNPAYWQGWSGALPDCELDATEKAKEWKAYGMNVTTLLTRQATIANIDMALENIFNEMPSDGKLFIMSSCHGGQESLADGLHEYLCAYDGPFWDYHVDELLKKANKGITVYWICDACHSGDMGRLVPVVFSRVALKDLQCKLFLLAGCAADKTSNSTGAGGAWRLSCSAVEDLYGQSVTEYFEAAKALMNQNEQLPILAEYGPITDADRDRKMLVK